MSIGEKYFMRALIDQKRLNFNIQYIARNCQSYPDKNDCISEIFIKREGEIRTTTTLYKFNRKVYNNSM